MGRKQEAEFEDRLKQIVDQGTDATAEEWLKIIEREYGKVPLIFKRMGERPEVLISHLLYKGSVAETSRLDPKYVELISMAVGAALKCQYCTELSHAGRDQNGCNTRGNPRSDPAFRNDLKFLGPCQCIPGY